MGIRGVHQARSVDWAAVLTSLRKSGINIVAIHHHMAMEEPRCIFLHYWGRGPALRLAQALHGALTTIETK